MGILISIVIVLFVIGSVMALKPSGVAMRRDKLRMIAYKLELHPSLVACPDWIRGTSGDLGKGMITRYSIIIEESKLPWTRYQIIKDHEIPQWRPLAIEKDGEPAEFSLDKQALDLPPALQPLIKGLEAKANSITLYWEDQAYVHPSSNPTYHHDKAETELTLMKAKLIEWARLINHSHNH